MTTTMWRAICSLHYYSNESDQLTIHAQSWTSYSSGESFLLSPPPPPPPPSVKAGGVSRGGGVTVMQGAASVSGLLLLVLLLRLSCLCFSWVRVRQAAMSGVRMPGPACSSKGRLWIDIIAWCDLH